MAVKSKLPREARTRALRKRDELADAQEQIREELEALAPSCFFADRFCGDALLYSLKHCI